MKRSHWTLLIVGVLLLTLGAPQAFARGMGGAPHPGGGGGGREGGGGRGGPPGGGGGGREGGIARGGSPGGGGPGREASSGGPRGGSSAGGGNRAGSSGGAGSREGGYGGGNASAAARNPTFSNANTNRNQSGASGKQGAAAGAAYSNRNQPAHSGAQGAAAGAAAANRNNPAYSGAQGAVAGAAAAGYHPSSENYGFYHGSYNGNWGAAAYGAAAVARPLAWGMGAWGSGASMYNSGYLGYSNPYYSGGGGGDGYDYSQPIPVASNMQAASEPADPAAEQPSPTDAAAADSPEEQLNPAIDAFKKGDYDTALNLVSKLIQKTPSDAVMHEFRALVLFAKHDYKQSAATIHSVLAVGPGWDWTTLSSLYSDIEIYNKQLQALESFVESHPQDGGAHFLLAYHYLTCGHPDSAAGEFQQVVKLVPTDKVAADMLKMVAPPKEGDNQPPEPENPKPSSKPVDPASLVGTWKAARDDGSSFEFALTKDSSFTWKYSQQKKTEEFGGTYSVEGNLLVLKRKDGSSLIGQLTPDGQKKFNFKMLGAPGDDPGLDFGR